MNRVTFHAGMANRHNCKKGYPGGFGWLVGWLKKMIYKNLYSNKQIYIQNL